MILTARGAEGAVLPIYRLGASQNVAVAAAGGASAQSTVVGANTEAVLVTCTTNDCRVVIGGGANPVASATSTLLPKPFAMIFQISPGEKVAVVSNDATVGSLNVTELLGPGPA